MIGNTSKWNYEMLRVCSYETFVHGRDECKLAQSLCRAVCLYQIELKMHIPSSLLILCKSVLLEQWFSKCILEPAVSASPGKLLDIQMVLPHPRHSDSETWGWLGLTAICGSTSPPDDSSAHWDLETAALERFSPEEAHGWASKVEPRDFTMN